MPHFAVYEGTKYAPGPTALLPNSARRPNPDPAARDVAKGRETARDMRL